MCLVMHGNKDASNGRTLEEAVTNRRTLECRTQRIKMQTLIVNTQRRTKQSKKLRTI